MPPHLSEYDFSIRTSYLLSELFFQEDREVLNAVIITCFKYSHACLLCVPEENTLMLDWYQDFP